MEKQLEKISEQLREDSLIEKLNNKETLTLKELFMLKNWIDKRIEKLVIE